LAKTRRYRIVHEDYLIEWLGSTFPPGTWRTNVRLGDLLIAKEKPISPAERAQLGGMFGASVDAVVVHKGEVILVEAMVRHEPGSGEDLLKYKMLLPYTTGYEWTKDKPIRLIILTPLELGWYEKFYNSLGIEVVHYKPLWIEEYLHTYPHKEWRGKLSRL